MRDAARAHSRRRSRGVAVPHPSGVQRAPLRKRDAALPAPLSGQRPGARPHDDPARLVHDEAQRHHGDDAGHVAGVRRRMHPFAPPSRPTATHADRRARGMLCAITGYDAVSLQPNAGSQGEYAGLLAIRAYHRDRGDGQRDVCLIPSCATAPIPPARMAGMRVVVVACDDARQRRSRRPRAQGRASTATPSRR